jgi:hypothetical protein
MAGKGRTWSTVVPVLHDRDQGYNVSNDAIAALVQADVRLWQRGSK